MSDSSLALTDGDILHLLFLATLDVPAILCNLVLIVAILKSTPIILQNYALLLLFIAITDCTAACMSLMSGAITENIEGAVIYVYIGPCRLIHETFCHSALALHIELIGESCVLLLISFSYRLFSFSSTLSSGPRIDIRGRLAVICLLATVPAALGSIAFVAASQYAPKPSLFEHPDLAGRYFGVFNLTAANQLSTENWLPRAVIFYIMALYFAAFPILYILRRRLLQKIGSLAVSSDKQRHKLILRSLTIQMLLPLFFSISFMLWIVDFLEIYQLKSLQRSVMPVSSTFTLISPLIILYYLPPYRKFVVDMINCISPNASSVLVINSINVMIFLLDGLSGEDSIHFLLLAVQDLSAIFANLLLITAIVRSTPIIIQNYSVLLLIMAIVDCNAALMSLLSCSIVENIDGAVIYIHIGPCRLISDSACNMAISIHIESIGEACVLLLISFAFRLISFPSTISSQPRSDHRLRLCGICLMSMLPAILAAISFAHSTPYPLKQSLLEHPELSGKYFSVFNLTATSQLSTENILPRASIFYIISVYLTVFPALVLLRRRLLGKIRSLVAPSDKMRHRMILRSLTIQMFLPLFFSLCFVIWILDFLGIYRLKTFQRLIMPIASAFALISPIVILYYLPPYRKFCIKLASRFRKVNELKVQSTNKRSAGLIRSPSRG